MKSTRFSGNLYILKLYIGDGESYHRYGGYGFYGMNSLNTYLEPAYRTGDGFNSKIEEKYDINLIYGAS